MDTLNDIISGLKWGNLDPTEAHDRVLALFSVSQQSELLLAYTNFIQQPSIDGAYTHDEYIEMFLSQ